MQHEIQAIDCDDELKQLLENKAVEDLRVVPSRVYEIVKDVMVKKHGSRVVLDMMSRSQAVAYVKRVHQAITGGDVFRVIESAPGRYISDTDTRNFLQFNISYTQDTKLQRITGFAHPELIKLVKYHNTSLFLDGTFKVAPQPYAQCVILMAFDRSTDLYIPVFTLLRPHGMKWHTNTFCTGSMCQHSSSWTH